MTLSPPSPSTRLLRAAAAERDDLARHRGRLTRARERLLGELRDVDDALALVDQRLATLARLAGEVGATGEVVELAARSAKGQGAPASALAQVASARADATPAELREPDENAKPHLLRGPAIREAAVRVLVAQPQPIEALHYRRWYELLEQAGFAVAGKDPLAVFLTQLSRSPVVRKASKPGVYELDPHAPLRMRQRLDQLQNELREVTLAPRTGIELAALRTRRQKLNVAISRQERALEEALRVLRRDDPDVVAARATGAS